MAEAADTQVVINNFVMIFKSLVLGFESTPNFVAGMLNSILCVLHVL